MKFTIPLVFIVIIMAFAMGCRKEDKFSTDTTDTLRFSVDTLIFDTVFTTIGSTTHILKVYNDNELTVNISDIHIADGAASNFRVNVDGESGVAFDNIEIASGDSIFIFVEVTVDPNNQSGPMVIEDHLNFLLNGNTQDVLLVAWGQDAIFHYPQNFIQGLPPFSCLDGDCFNSANPMDVTWNSQKPHVVYGYLIVDSLDHLTIDPGTQVHFHSGSGLWVWNGGQITVHGTADEKVVFQGDRLEYMYDDVPGQWDLIRINQGEAGRDNEFTHAIIKNSIIGIQATPLVLNANQANNPETSENRLILKNVTIQDNSDVALWARNYQVEAENCLFANAGRFTGLFQGGGSYQINFCTFANYWGETTRSEPSFFISNQYPSEADPNTTIIRSMSNSVIKNSIMYGNDFEEFAYDFYVTGAPTVDVLFKNNLYKVEETDLTSTYFQEGGNVVAGWSNEDPEFIDESARNFHISETSGARDKVDEFMERDLDEFNRDAPRDVGCYEYRP